MAIDTTKGLPSFSEMYQAFKTRSSLGSALESGLKGYETGTEIQRKGKAQESQSNLENAQAEYYKYKGTGNKTDFLPLSLITDPVQLEAAKPFATMNEQGVAVVPRSTVLAAQANTKQGAEAKDREDALAEKIRHAQELADRDAELARIKEQSGQETRSLDALKAAVNVGSKEPSPSIVGRGVSTIKEAFGGQPIASVLNERKLQADTDELRRRSGNKQASVVTEPSSVLKPTIKTNKPAMVPEFSTEEEARAAGKKTGERVIIGGVVGTLQ